MGIDVVLHNDPYQNIVAWQWLVWGKKKKVWTPTCFVSVWSIWFVMNQCKFKYDKIEWQHFMEDVKHRVSMWIKAFNRKMPYSILQIE